MRSNFELELELIRTFMQIIKIQFGMNFVCLLYYFFRCEGKVKQSSRDNTLLMLSFPRKYEIRDDKRRLLNLCFHSFQSIECSKWWLLSSLTIAQGIVTSEGQNVQCSSSSIFWSVWGVPFLREVSGLLINPFFNGIGLDNVWKLILHFLQRNCSMQIVLFIGSCPIW